MSRASRNARYYAKRKEQIFSLEERLKTLDEQYQHRIADLEDRLKTLSEEYQAFREERLKTPRARVEDESPSKESHRKERKKHLSRSPTASPEFDAFWAIWPNKVCKQKAFESYGRALARVTQAELLDGVRRYVASKPDSQQWCHAATWLNQDRWTDQPAPPVRQRMNGGGSNYSGLF